MWDTNGGIYLGYGASATEEDDRPTIGKEIRYGFDRHLMTIGPNGSGKSRRVLLPNLLALTDWSIVVVDPKGELCDLSRGPREAAGARTVILNPFGVLDLPSDGYNPIAALDTGDDFPDDALSLADSMIRIEGRDPHWGASAQDLLAALIMYSRLSQSDGGSLSHIRGVLGETPDEFTKTINLAIKLGKNRKCPELTAKAGRFAESASENREIASVLSTALTQTRWLDSRPIKRDLGKSTQHNFLDLKSHPTTIYIILPANRLGTHSTWMRLMIASILLPMLKDTSVGKVPLLLMLDEYPALAEGGFSIIEKNMAMFRGYGIKLWTVFQDLSQANRLYGEHWESFAANAGVLQSFAPQDVVTADYLSQRMPLRSMRAETTSRNFGGEGNDKSGHGSHSMNASEQGMPLMLPQHLRSMDDGFSVLFSHKNKGPLRSYFPFEGRRRDARL
jgi:type IV secretion system protein VirD4